MKKLLYIIGLLYSAAAFGQITLTISGSGSSSGGGPVWTFTNYTNNLILWLDSSTLSLANGAQVTNWNGIVSGVTNSSSTTYYTNNVWNGLGMVNFDGSAGQLESTNLVPASCASAVTIFALVKQSSSYSSTWPTTVILSEGVFYLATTTHNNVRFRNTDASPASPQCAWPMLPFPGGKTNQVMLIAARYNGSTLDLGDGLHMFQYSHVGYFPTNSVLTLGQFGGGSFFNGQIGEVRVYQEYLSQANMQNVGRYMLNKWGLDTNSCLQFIGIGDSIMAGLGGGVFVGEFFTNYFESPIAWMNFGENGQRITNVVNPVNLSAYQSYVCPWAPTVVGLNAGGNDIMTTDAMPGTNAASNIFQVTAQMRLTGAKVVAWEQLPRGYTATNSSYETERLSCNSVLSNSWSSYMDGFCNLCALSPFDTSYTNSTLTADHLHPNVSGDAIISGRFGQNIRKLFPDVK